MTVRRWKLTLEYDGGAFCGWQRQDGLPTVQQALEEAFEAFCQQRIEVTAAGRTDAGVHAKGQVVHADLDYGTRPLTGQALLRALNAHLRDRHVAVTDAVEAAPDFHARFHAVNKLYVYNIVNRSAQPIFEHRTATHIRRPLDIAAMAAATAILVGQHDFTTFRASQCQAKSPVRTLDRLDLTVTPCDAFGGTAIAISAEARSFLHHQIRNIVGALVMIGEGKWTSDDLAAALAARDRRQGGPTAPPEGLCLARVDY